MEMIIEAELLGGFSRSPRLRRILRRYEEKADTSFVEVNRVIWEETILLVGVQLGANLTSVVDPMVEFHDPLRPFVEAWRNVSIDGLLRWFDNNYFYRVPIFVDLPDPRRLVTPQRTKQLREVLPQKTKLKIVLPGPITFARLSRYPQNIDYVELVDSIASILRHEVSKSAENGANIVQLDEPFLGDVDASVDDAILAVETIHKIIKQVNIETRLAIPFNVPSEDVFKELQNLKVDYIILDFADYPERALSLARKYSLKALGLGIVNARDIYLEPYEKISRIVKTILREKQIDKILLTTSSWLNLVPQEYAIRKTNLLGDLYKRLLDELSSTDTNGVKEWASK